MKLSNKFLVLVLTLTFFALAFSVFASAVEVKSDIRYEQSQTNPNKHDIIINGQKVGEAFHRESGEATCQTKAICYECMAEIGDYAPHSFLEPTCTNPKTCSVCDYQEGDTIPHSGGEAKCLERAVCSGCGSEYGDILGHTGGEATCSTQAVCTRCGESYGATTQHTGGKATCQKGAICTVCSAEYGELGECVPGNEWVVEKDFHYQLCQEKECTTVFNDSDHLDKNKDGVCDVCQYKYKLSQAQLLWVIFGSSIAVIAIVGAVIPIVLIKKKRP